MARIWDEIKGRLPATTKKDGYVYLSLFLCVLLLAIIVNDAVHLTITNRPDQTYQNYTFALLVLHTAGFYLGLLGFVYITQTAGHTVRMSMLAVAGSVGNFVVLLLRIIIDVMFINFRPEYYRNFTESGK